MNWAAISMIKKLLINPFLLIFLLALFLRIYQLSNLPAGFHIDEVKSGWNAFSILKTGQDDWGNSFALHYNSFGDFRPTGYFYTVIPSILIFGLNEFAVRFPSAFLGVLTILVIYLLTLRITQNRKIALFSSSMLAVSPWHISLSRASSEGIVAVFLVLIGLYFLIGTLQTGKKIYLFISFVFLAASYFFYHSARLLVPLFMVATSLYYFYLNKPKVKLNYPVLILTVSFFLLTFIFGLSNEARARFSQVSILSDLSVRYQLDKMPFEEGPNNVLTARIFHNKLVAYSTRFIEEYSKYISSNFFIKFGEGKPLRYATTGNGIITYVEFLLLIFGLIAIAKNRAPFLPLLLLLISPLPAALTTEDSPNMHRAIFMSPFISIIAGFGFYYLTTFKKYGKIIIFSFSFLLVLNLIYFAHLYVIHNPVSLVISLGRNIGTKELMSKVGNLENQYDKVLFTNSPDTLYPWYAFYNKLDPAIFNKSAQTRSQGAWYFNKVAFTESKCPSRDGFPRDKTGHFLSSEKVLAVDSEGCETGANLGDDIVVVDRIYRGDEGIPYILWAKSTP